MKIEIIEKSDKFIKFSIYGINSSLANSLRRIMISEIETWAIDKVRFESNTTVLDSDIIAHRLGLVPLTNSDDTNITQVTFDFNKVAHDSYVETWYTNSLVPNNDIIKPIFPNIAIVKATRGQQLKFKAFAKRGKGLQHSKWSPVSSCYFKQSNDIIIFNVETIGSLSPSEIVQKAIKLLSYKLQNCLSKASIKRNESY